MGLADPNSGIRPLEFKPCSATYHIRDLGSIIILNPPVPSFSPMIQSFLHGVTMVKSVKELIPARCSEHCLVPSTCSININCYDYCHCIIIIKIPSPSLGCNSFRVLSPSGSPGPSPGPDIALVLKKC